jgi:hypothetical protein
MTLSGEASNVPSEGLTQLLLSTFQVLVVVRSHKRAHETTREDLHEIDQQSITFLGRWSNHALAESAR